MSVFCGGWDEWLARNVWHDGTQGAGLGMHGSEGVREVSGRGFAGCRIAGLPPCGLKGHPLSCVAPLCQAMRVGDSAPTGQ